MPHPHSSNASPSIDRATSCLLALMLIGASGCGEGQVLMDPNDPSTSPGSSDGSLNGEEGDYPAGPLHPDTVSVEELDCFDFADVLTDDRQFINLHFTCDASTAGITPGQIVWGLDDGGYLVRVVSVENDEDVAHLVTEFASIAEAVTDVEFDENIDLDDAARANTVDLTGRVLDEVEVEGGNATVTVTSGSLSMNSKVGARGSFGFLRLKSVTSRTRLDLNLDMNVDYHADGPVERAQTVEVDQFDQPFTLKVGPVRVRGVLRSTVSIGFEHRSTGPVDVSTSFSGGGTVIMGGTYTMPETWSPYWNPSFTGEVIELQPDGMDDWDGRVFLHIEGTVLLNGNSNGTSWYELGSDGHSQGTCESITSQTAGTIEAQTGMRLRFMGRSVDHDFPPVNETLDSKEGTIWHASPPAGCPGETGSGLCASAQDITCGSTIYGDTAMDSMVASEMDAYPCAVGNYDAPELVYRWVAQATASPVEFRLLGAEPTVLNHDLFVLGGGDGCSAESCVAFGFNSVQFDPVPGQTYFLAVDGFDDNAGAFGVELDCGGL